MKDVKDMTKAEMEQEISFAENFVNNGGILTANQWNRVVEMMNLLNR